MWTTRASSESIFQDVNDDWKAWYRSETASYSCIILPTILKKKGKNGNTNPESVPQAVNMTAEHSGVTVALASSPRKRWWCWSQDNQIPARPPAQRRCHAKAARTKPADWERRRRARGGEKVGEVVSCDWTLWHWGAWGPVNLYRHSIRRVFYEREKSTHKKQSSHLLLELWVLASCQSFIPQKFRVRLICCRFFLGGGVCCFVNKCPS